MTSINLMVDGGEAKAGAAMGTTLGPLGLNMVQVLNDINAKTKEFKGIQVPITLDVDPKTKAYEITVGTPPTSQLIKSKIKLEKGSGKAGAEIVGNVSMADVESVARMKLESNPATSEKSMIKQVIGTCASMGLTIDGKKAKEIMQTYN